MNLADHNTKTVFGYEFTFNIIKLYVLCRDHFAGMQQMQQSMNQMMRGFGGGFFGSGPFGGPPAIGLSNSGGTQRHQQVIMKLT